MCVAQFRDYCNAFSFKRKSEITSNDEIDHSRGTFFDNNSSYYYIENKKKMKALKKQGNQYAK